MDRNVDSLSGITVALQIGEITQFLFCNFVWLKKIDILTIKIASRKTRRKRSIKMCNVKSLALNLKGILQLTISFISQEFLQTKLSILYKDHAGFCLWIKMLNKALLEGEKSLTYATHCFKCQNICYILNSFNLNKPYRGF